jgi:hypothetical protein
MVLTAPDGCLFNADEFGVAYLHDVGSEQVVILIGLTPAVEGSGGRAECFSKMRQGNQAVAVADDRSIHGVSDENVGSRATSFLTIIEV